MNTNIKSYNENDASMGENGMEYLKPPDKGKLFFISPPPSPPLGWTMRDEGAPNKMVHAEDLAVALAKIRAGVENDNDDGVAAADIMDQEADGSSADAEARQELIKISGSNATLVYHPSDHGSRTDLPAVLVEDVSSSSQHTETKLEQEQQQQQQRIMTHTARPPVELMLDHDDNDDPMDIDIT